MGAAIPGPPAGLPAGASSGAPAAKSKAPPPPPPGAPTAKSKAAPPTASAGADAVVSTMSLTPAEGSGQPGEGSAQSRDLVPGIVPQGENSGAEDAGDK